MMRIILLTCALAFTWQAATAEQATPLTESAPHIEVARWMTEQPDADMRAAGLAALSAMGQPGPAIEPSQFLSEAQALIEANPSATAAFLLAQGCDRLDVLDACEDAGVLEAVNRLDGGNPLAASLFHAPGSPAFRDMLLNASQVDDHLPETVSVWFKALQSDAALEVEEETELGSALGISLATALPTLEPLSQRCRAAVQADEALDRACQRLSEQMRTSGRTLLVRHMGYGMAINRAEETGNQALADRLKADAREIQRLSHCLPESATRSLSKNPETQQRYLSLLQGQGEVAATEWLIEEFGSSCEENASPA